MKWPAIVRFENSDELEIIESPDSWNAYLQTVSTDCQLILSDGALFNIAINTDGSAAVAATGETIDVSTAVELARRHMSALAHCCVSKFNAPSVEAVIVSLIQLDD